MFERGSKFFELSNHLGNVLVTLSDKRIGIDANTDGVIDYYEGDVASAQDYYPGGMIMPGRSYNTSLTRYGYQGSERDQELNPNTYKTRFRELDTRINRWWSVDPKSSASPWLSPYVSMSNNPIMLVDPLGDKEYKSERQFERKNKGKIWEKDKGRGDWLRSDRLGNTTVWKNANEHNLKQDKGYDQYSSISERRDFYQWFQTTTEQLGSDTKWAGAATIVATQMTQVEDPLNAWIVGQDIVNFAKAGNKAIFNDVFSDLRGLYKKGASGSPLKGEAAKPWDAIFFIKNSL